MNEKAVYDQLADHLGRGGLAALPKTPELYEMLEILFTPEQVEYAIQMVKVRDVLPAKTGLELREQYMKEMIS